MFERGRRRSHHLIAKCRRSARERKTHPRDDILARGAQRRDNSDLFSSFCLRLRHASCHRRFSPFFVRGATAGRNQQKKIVRNKEDGIVFVTALSPTAQPAPAIRSTRRRGKCATKMMSHAHMLLPIADILAFATIAATPPLALSTGCARLRPSTMRNAAAAHGVRRAAHERTLLPISHRYAHQ